MARLKEQFSKKHPKKLNFFVLIHFVLNINVLTNKRRFFRGKEKK